MSERIWLALVGHNHMTAFLYKVRRTRALRLAAHRLASARWCLRQLPLAAAIGAGVIASVSAVALASNQAKIRLQGDITPECSLLSVGGVRGSSPNMNVDLGDITRRGSTELGFGVNCNAPFAYRLEAEHGALTHKAQTSAPRGFLTAVPYDVSVHIPTSGASIDDRCTGASIRSGAVNCAFSTSGNEIALGTAAHLTLNWLPDGIPVAGEYVDRLTITVSVRQ